MAGKVYQPKGHDELQKQDPEDLRAKKQLQSNFIHVH